jgi:hypothetical protein
LGWHLTAARSYLRPLSLTTFATRRLSVHRELVALVRYVIRRVLYRVIR